MWLDKYIHYSSSHQFKNIPWYKNWTTLAQLQSNRMFFWWELCKLPLEHWYFGWQFESSKLQPAWASCSVHLVPHGKNSLKFSKMFQVLLQYFEDGYVSFCVDEPLNNYQDLLDRVKNAVPSLQGVDEGRKGRGVSCTVHGNYWDFSRITHHSAFAV